MKVSKTQYAVYILTNFNKTVLYIGVTNDLEQRLIEHFIDSNNPLSNKFTAKYKAIYLVYYESYNYVNDAIAREKEIKKWRREKKDNLIDTINPNRDFLNIELLGEWPPKNLYHRSDG
ncbi:MAG: GIY-YIG nuclease family protein [Ferruginibacter sp.]|nr:GIY-YIG nuclease family protein [Ferruginibacter sp.]